MSSPESMVRKQQSFFRRRGRVRSKVSGTAARPRLSVYRSLLSIYAQLIDDTTGTTLVSVSDRGLKGNKTEKARQVGEQLATVAVAKQISVVVFDRGGRRYHGRVKALADAARQGGLQF